jgi:hypothetical protein
VNVLSTVLRSIDRGVSCSKGISAKLERQRAVEILINNHPENWAILIGMMRIQLSPKTSNERCHVQSDSILSTAGKFTTRVEVFVAVFHFALNFTEYFFLPKELIKVYASLSINKCVVNKVL